ncbi:MAG: hypothetical protein OXC37_00165 [Bdellovibrionaceae bacterium]|nr:hypothetical protein [Pseudobdellovibrionaceae bacterium]
MKSIKLLFLLIFFASTVSAESLKETRAVSNTVVSSSSAFVSEPVVSKPFLDDRFLEFGLEYPISFGVNLKYLLMDSAYARFGLGFISEVFLDSFEKIADSFGYLNSEEAKLLSDTLKNSIYLDFRLAWAPYLQSEGGGPYLELGLSHSRYGKGGSKGIILRRVLKDDSIDETKKYSVRTNTYNANFHVGYQIPFNKVNLNFEVGLIKILKADLLNENSIEYPDSLSTSQKNKFTEFLETKGWIFPTFSAWISFAF